MLLTLFLVDHVKLNSVKHSHSTSVKNNCTGFSVSLQIM